MQVYKFGGTSVGSPARMKQVASLITHSKDRKIVVLSAVSGTTNNLVSISEFYKLGKIEEALTVINQMREQYNLFVKELLTSEFGLNKGQFVVADSLNQIERLVNQPLYKKADKFILAQGEIMSTHLFQCYLDEQGISSVLINALDFMLIDDKEEPALKRIENKLTPILEGHAEKQLLITQGYICRNHTGSIDNLKRGGSDYTATLIGAAIQAEEVQIWTDIDGVHNNDPRIVEDTMPIAQLSFEEAGELAYFGAKILHPSCIIPAQQRNVPVRIKNTMDPAAAGTLITAHKNPDKIKAIAVKDGITAIKIKSTRMVNAYGFLRKIFEVFEKYRTPIDMITTSEIAVSLSIDDPSRLEEIISELRPFGIIEIDKEQSIICIVGDFVAQRKGIGKEIFIALENIPVRMISYGGSKNNISLLIDSGYKNEALKTLNQFLFKPLIKI
ncbi:MAG: aspartate kinase [Cyclobacteriaceae bacterium]